MSYILDALRKAERDRPRPLARVPAPPSIEESRGFRYWPWALGGVIALNTALLLWMVLPGADTRSERRPAASTSLAPSESAPVSPPSRGAEAPAAAAGDRSPAAPLPAVADRGSPAVADRGSPAAASPRTPAAAPSVPAVREPAAARPSVPERIVSAGTAPAERTSPAAPREPTPAAASPVPPVPASASRTPVAKPGTAERPTATASAPAAPPAPAAAPPAASAASREPVHAIDAQLQRLRLQFVAYSEVPAERFVFIDNQKLVEGQTVDNGVVIERIDAASVVLKHPGGRFILRADPRVSR